ncbi:Gamma-tubulin complex component 5, partial [Actinomortierella ambigua]
MRRQRLSTTIPPAASQLVQRVTGARPGDARFDNYAQYVCTQLYEVGGIGSNRNKYFERSTIDRRIKGLAEKFSLRGQEDRAQALEEYLRRIRELFPALLAVNAASGTSSTNSDAENVLSSILLVLLDLSESPTTVAMQHPSAHKYSIPWSLQKHKQPQVDENTRNKAIWQSILKEEPLEGEHWATVREDVADSDDSDYDDMDLTTIGKKPKDQLSEDEQSTSQDPSKSQTAATSVRFSQLPLSSSSDGRDDILQDLENLQYWQASNISKKRHDRVQAHRQITASVQDPASVNMGLEQFQSDAFAADTFPMDELDLIHETLLMLLGEYSICFQRHQDQNILPRKGIILSHLSPSTLNNILLELSTHGARLCKIESAARGVCSQPIQAIGKVVQTFACSTLSIVREKRQLFSRLQQRYRHANTERSQASQLLVSLLELYDDVSRQFAIVADLERFVENVLVIESSGEASCRVASNLLSELHDVACQAELAGNQESFEMFRNLLRDSMIPLLQSIQDWLNGEQMPDEKDFFIKENPSVTLFSGDYWESGYSFQADISEGADSSLVTKLLIPSFFKSDDLDMILYIGKAALNEQLMNTTFAKTLTARIFGDQTPQSSQSSRVSPTPLPSMAGIIAAQFPLWKRPTTSSQTQEQELHGRRGLDSLWGADDLAIPTTTNFQWQLDRELSEAIKGQYARINRGVHYTMSNKCRLWWHIEGMCSFYLMMNGEVMNDFSHALFKKLVLTSGASSYAKRQL